MLALYLLASALAGACAWLGSRAERSWWLAIAIILIAILAVRAADPAQWLDGALQQGLHALGWYDHRRPIQVAAIALAVLLLIVAAAKFVVARVRDIDGSGKCAAAAMFLLLAFATVRGSSLHWTDAILEQRVAAMTLSHLLQALLLVVIAGSATWWLAVRQAAAPRSSKAVE